MPLYDYRCAICEKEFEAFRKIEERAAAPCPYCSRPGSLLLTARRTKDWFRPHWNEHLSPDGPIYVRTKEHYRQLCKQHGVEARCLM